MERCTEKVKEYFTTPPGESATWTGQGIGQLTQEGTTRFHSSLFFDAHSATDGAFGFLKNMVGIFHFVIDNDGITTSKVWEWEVVEHALSKDSDATHHLYND